MGKVALFAVVFYDVKRYSGGGSTGQRKGRKMKRFALKGHICYSTHPDRLEIRENSYLLCEEGECRGVVKELPQGWKEAEVKDYGTCLIIPGLTDLHMHAPQYGFCGMGMDMELLQWLEHQVFPEEAKYADLEYAEKGYRIFAENLKKGATTRACIFSSLHVPATELLMEKLEETGLKVMVGKVNMDRNSPDILREESAEASEAATRQWLKDIEGKFKRVQPILTPRFIPSCTDELMERLSHLQQETGLPVQSHLSENLGEIAWVKELCPWSSCYGDAYDHFRMFGTEQCKTIMAHCVYSDDQEMELMKKRGVWIAHCPLSNGNLASGIAPVREFLNRGLNVGLGSDVSGGNTDSIFRVMADAVQASKMYWRLIDQTKKPLTLEEVFYMATKGGGSFFGNVGSFEEGYELDAVVLDDRALKTPMDLTVRQRLERICYLSDDRQIAAKYVAGEEIRLV